MRRVAYTYTIFALCILHHTAYSLAEDRTWTDVTGKNKINGQLIDFDGSVAVIRTSDGEAVERKIEYLSKKDRVFIITNPRTGIGIQQAPFIRPKKPSKAKTRSKHTQPPTEKTLAAPKGLKTGIVVLGVVPGTPAESARLKPGDIIVSVDGKPAREGIVGYLTTDKPHELEIYTLVGKDAPTWDRAKVLVMAMRADELKAILDEIEIKQCPLVIEGAKFGEDSIGTPILTVTVRNRSAQPAVAFKLTIESWNKFGEPVRKFGFGDNDIGGISQETLLEGKTATYSWKLYGQNTAREINVTIQQVKRSDGSVWRPADGFESKACFTVE